MNEDYKDANIEEIIEKYRQGQSISRLAEAYKFPSKKILRNAIRKYQQINEASNKMPSKYNFTDRQKEKMYNLYKEGVSIEKLSIYYKRTTHVIKNIICEYCSENGLEVPEHIYKRNSCDKLEHSDARKNKKIEIPIEEIVEAYKNNKIGELEMKYNVSSSTIRNRLRQNIGDDYSKLLKPCNVSDEQKLMGIYYEEGLSNVEIATINHMLPDTVGNRIDKLYKIRKIKKPKVVCKSVFLSIMQSNGNLEKTIEQAKSRNAIVPDSYIQNYLNPKENIDIISMQKNIIKKLTDVQKEQKKQINFLDAFELSRGLKNKGYNTKYQAIALMYKLIKDNNLPHNIFFDEQYSDLQIIVEGLLNNDIALKNGIKEANEYISTIQNEEILQEEEKLQAKEKFKQGEDR